MFINAKALFVNNHAQRDFAADRWQQTVLISSYPFFEFII